MKKLKDKRIVIYLDKGKVKVSTNIIPDKIKDHDEIVHYLIDKLNILLGIVIDNGKFLYFGVPEIPEDYFKSNLKFLAVSKSKFYNLIYNYVVDGIINPNSSIMDIDADPLIKRFLNVKSILGIIMLLEASKNLKDLNKLNMVSGGKEYVKTMEDMINNALNNKYAFLSFGVVFDEDPRALVEPELIEWNSVNLKNFLYVFNKSTERNLNYDSLSGVLSIKNGENNDYGHSIILPFIPADLVNFKVLFIRTLFLHVILGTLEKKIMGPSLFLLNHLNTDQKLMVKFSVKTTILASILNIIFNYKLTDMLLKSNNMNDFINNVDNEKVRTLLNDLFKNDNIYQFGKMFLETAILYKDRANMSFDEFINEYKDNIDDLSSVIQRIDEELGKKGDFDNMLKTIYLTFVNNYELVYIIYSLILDTALSFKLDAENVYDFLTEFFTSAIHYEYSTL